VILHSLVPPLSGYLSAIDRGRSRSVKKCRGIDYILSLHRT
jgi:hypothetical protein